MKPGVYADTHFETHEARYIGRSEPIGRLCLGSSYVPPLMVVRHEYRVLLTRGMASMGILCLDEETREFLANCLSEV